MDYPISKRAALQDALVQFVSTIYNENEGPFENAFRILPYAAIPFLGSLGKVVTFILTKLALNILGLSPQELGRSVDEALGLKPGDDPRQPGRGPAIVGP